MSDTRNQAPILTMAQVDELERLYPGEILRGYQDGVKGAPWPDRDVTPAYEHGRRNGVGDRTGSVDPEQRILAADHQARARCARSGPKP